MIKRKIIKKELDKIIPIIIIIYTSFLFTFFIIMNFIIFLLFGYAWLISKSSILGLLVFISGGNIILFILTFNTYIQETYNMRKNK